jgi:hypothetical protein
MTTPKKIVEEFISQACSLFDQHSEHIKELGILKKNNKKNKELETKYQNMYWDAVRLWRQEHKKLCESFGFKITEQNFSSSCYRSPIIYNKHKVMSEENISPKKTKIFTENLDPKDNDGIILVFYCELKQDRWIISKLREIHKIDDPTKEQAPWCW